MDHVVYLDAGAKELENLVNGNKAMILRGADERKLPHGNVNEGDMLYFINNNGKKKLKQEVSFHLFLILNDCQLRSHLRL